VFGGVGSKGVGGGKCGLDTKVGVRGAVRRLT